MAQTVVFMFLVTFTFDLYYILFVTRTRHAVLESFIRIGQVLMSDMPRTHTQTNKHTPNVKSIVSGRD